MKRFLRNTIMTIIWSSLLTTSPAWSRPQPPELPAITHCLAARNDYPTGRQYYTHFFALAETTQHGLAEFCLSFVQDPRGVEHAATWLQRSAHKGLPEAQLLLGSGHESGKRVDEDPALARYWYEQAAHQNLAHAQYELATVYYSGQRLGLPQDFSHAYFWNRLALQQDFPPAVTLHTILEQLITTETQEQVHDRIDHWNHTHASHHR